MTAWNAIRSAWDDIRFWRQVIEDNRRTLICSSELESRVKTMVASLGLTGVVDVQVSPFVPDDQVFVVDHHAIEATTNQILSLRPTFLWRST